MKNISEEKPIFMPRSQDADQDQEDDEVWNNKGCNWFGACCLGRRRNDPDGGEGDTLLRRKGASAEAWWKSPVKKVKQMSEKLAGPKWKNLVRKMGGYFNKQGGHKNSRFQYDPHSYALNFDNGDADRQAPDDLLFNYDYQRQRTTASS